VIGWDGRTCTVEAGAGVATSSLELRVDPAPGHEVASTNAFSHRTPAGRKVYPCATMASNWPDKPGTYDVTVREAATRREVTKRIWIDPEGEKRELQRATMTLRDVYAGSVLLGDGVGLFVARLGSAGAPFRDALTGQDAYRDRTVYDAFDDINFEGGPATLAWEAVSGIFAGLAPSASRLGDQLLISGTTRHWTVRARGGESTIASWAPHMFIEEFTEAPNESIFATVLSGRGSLRRVSLRQAANCDWEEREDWLLETPDPRVLAAAAFNGRGQAAFIVIDEAAGDGMRSSLRVGGDSLGKAALSNAYELPQGISFPAYARAGARVEEDGAVRGAFIAHVPDTGWNLFEVVARAGTVALEHTKLPVQSISVGRVDFDGADPMWVVRRSDSKVAAGHRGKLDESCAVEAIVEGAPFIGGGTIAWQTHPGSPVRVGLCEWREFARTTRPK